MGEDEDRSEDSYTRDSAGKFFVIGIGGDGRSGDTKQRSDPECDALFGPGTDDVVERDSSRHGQQRGIEHRHARQLSDGKRRSRDNPIQEQARQNFVTVSAVPSLDG